MSLDLDSRLRQETQHTCTVTEDTVLLPSPPPNSRNLIKQFVLDLQEQICQGLEEIDGEARFQEDTWERSLGGGGRTRVIREGRVFEQGSVNFSEVWGENLPASILTQRQQVIASMRRELQWYFTPPQSLFRS